MLPHRTLALLLALTGACTPTAPEDESSGTDGTTAPDPGNTDTSSATEQPTTEDPTTEGPTTEDPTTGDPNAFPMCPEATNPDDIGFKILPGTFPLGDTADIVCDVHSGASQDSPTWTINLSCPDLDNNPHLVTIELELFHEPPLTVFDPDQLRLLYHRDPLVEDVVETLALRGLDDSLQLFLARGFGVLDLPATADFAAPVQIAVVRDELCPAVGDCDTTRRLALDVTLGEATKRVFDRAWSEFESAPSIGVHVGRAREIVLNTTGECASDSPSGVETTIVIFGQQS